jgi:hypothetical protein
LLKAELVAGAERKCDYPALWRVFASEMADRTRQDAHTLNNFAILIFAAFLRELCAVIDFLYHSQKYPPGLWSRLAGGRWWITAF